MIPFHFYLSSHPCSTIRTEIKSYSTSNLKMNLSYQHPSHPTFLHMLEGDKVVRYERHSYAPSNTSFRSLLETSLSAYDTTASEISFDMPHHEHPAHNHDVSFEHYYPPSTPPRSFLSCLLDTISTPAGTLLAPDAYLDSPIISTYSPAFAAVPVESICHEPVHYYSTPQSAPVHNYSTPQFSQENVFTPVHPPVDIFTPKKVSTLSPLSPVSPDCLSPVITSFSPSTPCRSHRLYISPSRQFLTSLAINSDI